jgi:hypothetical protein
LAFYLKVNPDTLTDEEWAMQWARLQWSLDWMQKNKMNSFGI